MIRENKSSLANRRERKRYLAIVIQMRIVVEPDQMKYFKHLGIKLVTLEDWKNEVRAEWFNLLLFATDDVIKSLKEFIQKPENATYAKTVIAMRKDLWNKKTSLRTQRNQPLNLIEIIFLSKFQVPSTQ